jgi:hypothetical protein
LRQTKHSEKRLKKITWIDFLMKIIKTFSFKKKTIHGCRCLFGNFKWYFYMLKVSIVAKFRFSFLNCRTGITLFLCLAFVYTFSRVFHCKNKTKRLFQSYFKRFPSAWWMLNFLLLDRFVLRKLKKLFQSWQR